MFAATSPQASKNGYYGPQNMFGSKGKNKINLYNQMKHFACTVVFIDLKKYIFTGPCGNSWIPGAAKNVEVAKKLWEVSETLTKITWPAPENNS